MKDGIKVLMLVIALLLANTVCGTDIIVWNEDYIVPNYWVSNLTNTSGLRSVTFYYSDYGYCGWYSFSGRIRVNTRCGVDWVLRHELRHHHWFYELNRTYRLQWCYSNGYVADYRPCWEAYANE